jgi:hypothetical protein
MSTEQIDISEARCLGCGYQLRGLQEHRCPECGRCYDPSDPETMKVPGWKHGRRLRRIEFRWEMLKLATAATLFCIVGMGYPSSYRHWNPYNRSAFFAFYGQLLWVVFFAALLIRSLPVLVKHTKKTRGTQTATTKVGLTVLIIAMLSSSFLACHQTDWCAHADYHLFGWFGLAYSETGGPCRNWAPSGSRRIAGNWYLIGNIPEWHQFVTGD